MREWECNKERENEDLIYYSHRWFFICFSYHQHTVCFLSLPLYVLCFIHNYINLSLISFDDDEWFGIFPYSLLCCYVYLCFYISSPHPSIVFLFVSDTDNVFLFVCLLLFRLCIIVYVVAWWKIRKFILSFFWLSLSYFTSESNKKGDIPFVSFEDLLLMIMKKIDFILFFVCYSMTLCSLHNLWKVCTWGGEKSWINVP